MKKNWIVFSRSAGTVRPVGRFAYEATAKARTRGAHRYENLSCAFVPDLSPSMRRALGVKIRASR